MHKKDPTPIEAIDFESLHNQTEVDSELTQTATRKLSTAWLTFVILILCGIAVFLFLPKYVSKHKISAPLSVETPIHSPPSPKAPEPIQEAKPSISAEERDELRLQAEKLLLQIIKQQESLQAQGITKWAADEFVQATALGMTGDEYYRKKLYLEAIDTYEQAINALDHIEQQLVPTLAKHLQQGELALTQGDRETAVHHFELAKSIDVKNIQALNGLKRAETLQQLFALLEKGGIFEAVNRLEDAKLSYQQAVELDSLSQEAKAALTRVTHRLTNIKFSRLIANGFSLLEARQFEDARRAFITARKLIPSSNKPNQGIAKIEQAIRSEKISALTAEAQHFEGNEDWGFAAQSYQQILDLASNSALAIDGVARNQQRATLLTKLDDHLARKERLSSVQISNQVEVLLQEIASLDNPGNNIIQRATKLEGLLKLSKQPVSILLQSDNQTDVVIFKVGKFGQFENKKIELKPGKYTIVGSRAGFRDVRKILTVAAEMDSNSISIRCEEPI